MSKSRLVILQYFTKYHHHLQISSNYNPISHIVQPCCKLHDVPCTVA